MNHADHVRLLRKGIADTGKVWADFGSGEGAFTLALAEILGPKAEIHSVDRNEKTLARQLRAVGTRFPDTRLQVHLADFRQPLSLPPLDGLLVANALHYLPQKEPTVRLLARYLRPGGRFIVVEYDTNAGNHWVPYPFSYERWVSIAARCSLQQTKLLAQAPSSFLGRFYSAVSLQPAIKNVDVDL